MNRMIGLLCIFCLLLLPASMALAQETTPEPAAMDGTVVDVAAEQSQFSTLVTALEAAGLTDALTSSGPYTIFAPTDSAFESSLAAVGMTLDDLLANTDYLTQVLQYHVVEGELTADSIAEQAANGAATLTTLEGSNIMVSVSGETISLNGNPLLSDAGTVVSQTDISASNGVIHAIDSVLFPENAPVADGEVATAHIRLAHLSPDAPPIELYINGTLSDIQALSFPNVTGWIEIPADTYDMAIAPFDSSVDESVIGPLQLSFAPNSWTTLTTVGLYDNIDLNLVFEDLNTPIPQDQARLSLYHAIYDAGAVDVLVDGDVLISNVAFPTAGGQNDGAFIVDVPAGTYDLQIVPTGQTEPVILDLPGTQIEAGTFYLFAAIGSQANPDVLIQSISMPQLMGEAGAPPVEANTSTVSLFDELSNRSDLSTLASAIEAAGLQNTLTSDGPFTLLAPTNAAFETLADELGMASVDELLADTDTLTSILQYHVISEPLNSADLQAMVDELEAPQTGQQIELATVQGDNITFSTADGQTLANGALITEADIETSNGVLHIINDVLLPPTSEIG